MLILLGISCQHACASMRVNNLIPENFVNDCYKVETFLKIYNHIITPIPGQEQWQQCDFPEVTPLPVDPPKPSRPKKVRKKNNEELENNARTKISKKGGKMVCSICHQEGHNKRKHGPRTTGVNDTTEHAPTQMAQEQMKASTIRAEKLPVK
jgi:hypothetical protein